MIVKGLRIGGCRNRGVYLGVRRYISEPRNMERIFANRNGENRNLFE